MVSVTPSFWRSRCSSRVIGAMQIAAVFACADLLRGDPPRELNSTPSPLVVRNALREAMRQTFKYDPAIHKKAEEDGVAEEGVIRLEPFLVTEKEISPALVRHFAHKRELIEANKPSVANGFAKAIGPNVSVGLKPYDYDFLPSPKPIPNWPLVNLRW